MLQSGVLVLQHRQFENVSMLLELQEPLHLVLHGQLQLPHVRMQRVLRLQLLIRFQALQLLLT